MKQAAQTENQKNLQEHRFQKTSLGLIGITSVLLCLMVWSYSFDIPDIPAKYAFIAQSWLSVLLFAVVAVQAAIYIGQWRVMRESLRQSESIITSMGEQLAAMNRQAELMERQSGILERSVEAAEASAKAAQDNIGLIVDKERARIRVYILPLSGSISMSPSKSKDPVFSSILIKVFNQGPYAARIIRARAEIDITQSTDAPMRTVGDVALGPDPRTYLNIPPFFKPNIDGMEILIGNRNASDWNAISEGRQIVHFSGSITYRDHFERDERITSFQCYWRVDPGQAATAERGYWKRYGNNETT
jgi:hypothetical protein